jgi:hypothetical protein
MKKRIYNYDILKRYIASVNSSVTVSFHDFSRTILKDGPKDVKDVRTNKKQLKKDIRKDLKIIKEIQTKTRGMCLIFNLYVKDIVREIIKKRTNPNSNVQEIINIDQINSNEEEENDENSFIKIGHYLVNFNMYDIKENDITLFMESSLFNEIMHNKEHVI